uniref:EF-hand domain-containing protein n=1 Tax=Trichuris muris TaxID=70415 RepID=A0A5S6QRW7_TRIMR
MEMSRVRRRRKGTEIKQRITAEQRKEIEDVFKLYDPEASGKMDVKNLKFAMRALGFEPKAEEVKVVLSEFNIEGEISSAEFLDIVAAKFAENGSRNEIMKAYTMFIGGSCGKITFDDLKRVAKELGESISDEELREMIEEGDYNKDGMIDQEEFYQLMKKTNIY